MTTPYERKQIETNEGVFPTDALKRAREHRRLAHEFLNASQTPGIAALPHVTLTVKSVCLCALAALGAAELAHKALSHLYGPVLPFSRLVGGEQTVGVTDAVKSTIQCEK